MQRTGAARGAVCGRDRKLCRVWHPPSPAGKNSSLPTQCRGHTIAEEVKRAGRERFHSSFHFPPAKNPTDTTKAFIFLLLLTRTKARLQQQALSWLSSALSIRVPSDSAVPRHGRLSQVTFTKISLLTSGLMKLWVCSNSTSTARPLATCQKLH